MNDPQNNKFRDWPHSPRHQFTPGAIYMVTAAVLHRKALFNSPRKLDALTLSLFEEAERHHWELQAWAVMANHYHFIAQAPSDADSLKTFIRSLHSKTARWLNQQDGESGRKVWFQYWDTCLTYEKSYLARLNYVHRNPVRHDLVKNAEEYRWCSMGWFMRNAPRGFRDSVLSFKTDRVNIIDDF